LRKFLFQIFIWVAVLSLTGCASLKNSKIDKFYQNLTAHYNIYFNAYQSYLKVVNQTETNYVDDYTNILHVLKFPDETSGKANSSNVDFILTKCSKILEKKKLSNWIDDSYLLIGKAYFYRGDYFSALETLQYIEDEYQGSTIAQEAQVWIARCMYQQKKYGETKAFITLIKSNTAFSNQILKELLLTEAMVDIKNENYLAASNNLKEAVKYENKKTNKSRYLFIIAQLLQKTGNLKQATEYYEKVIKRNPPYEMAFHSKIEISHCYSVTDEKSARPIRGLLEKMLLDDKNIQYFDQIYLELGLLELKLNNTKKAEEYLKLSIKYNQSNENLKGVAFMKLADYYFSMQNYKLAKNYYDSTITNLNENYPDYDKISARNKMLADLVKYIVTAEAEDSLQYLARLPEKSRDSLINIAYENELKQIREKEKAEQERKMAEEQEMRMSRQMMQSRQQGYMQPPGMDDNLSGKAKWYFYNQSAMTLGKSEFMVKWGKRKLEDNWRISQKNTDFGEVEEETEKEEAIEDIVAVLSETEKKQIDSFLKNIPKEKQKYYTDIPFTPAQMEASRKREIEALKRAGDIFLESLKDTAGAIQSYEKLLKKYPDSKYAAYLHYNLYLLYTKPADADKKSAHKEALQRDFPNSDFVILLENPDYFKEKLLARNTEIQQLYSQTYEYYLANDCKKVQENNEISKTKYSGHQLRPYFEYLSIICNAKNMKKDELIKALTDFQKSYGKENKLNDEVSNLLAYLNNEIVISDGSTTNKEGKKDEPGAEKPAFILDNKAPHYFVYAFESRKYNSNEIKTAFSEYNAKFYGMANLEINSIMLNNDLQLIIVREFPDKDKAFEYLAGIKSDENFLTKIKNRNPQIFIILQENLTEMVKKQEVKSYFDFYTKNYFSK